MLFLIAILLFGVLITYLLDDDMPPLLRATLGVPLGFAVSGLVAFVFGLVFKLSTPTLFLTLLVMGGIPLLLLRKRLPAIREEWRTVLLPNPNVVTWFCILTLMLALFFRRAAYQDAEGIGTGVWDSYADLAYHLGFIQSFLIGDNFPPEHPMYAGTSLTYPFMADFQVSVLMKAGLPMMDAMFLHNILLILALAGLLFAFTLRVTRSRVAAFAAPWLLFLCGGLGFMLIFPEAQENGQGILEFLSNLSHDFTEWQQTLYFGNSLVYWFAPMRGMILSAPLMVAVWWFWWGAIGSSKEALMQKRLRAAGILTGLIPLVHTHTFLDTVGMGICLSLLGRWQTPRYTSAWWKGWAISLAIAIVMAIPQIFLLFSGSKTQTTSFFGVFFGWMSKEAELDPFRYWLLNLGLFIPVLLISLFWRHKGKPLARPELRRFYLPFWLCFIAPNLIKFAPWEWDNIKVLYVWFIASVPLVALVIARLWDGAVVGSRALAMTLFLLLTLSGGMDVWRVCSGGPGSIIFVKDSITFSERIAESTPPRAVILCAPVHNSPVMLAGRIAFMNYPGFLWTNGLPHEEREQEVKAIYSGAPNAEELLRERGIDYIILGPQEKDWAAQYNVPLNDAFFSRFPIIASHGPYRLLSVQNLNKSR